MSESQDFATKLDWLFQHKLKPETGKPYTPEEVAKQTGVSPAHLRRLKQGLSRKPSLDLAERLTEFFGVDLSFFATSTKTGQESETSLDTLNLARMLEMNPGAKKIALRANTELKSEAEQELLLNLIEQLVEFRKKTTEEKKT